MLKRVQSTIDDDPIAKIVRRDSKIKQRSRSPVDKSRSRSREKKNFVPLRK